MSDSVDRVFSHALNTVKKIPRSGSSRPPPESRLLLYGLYKQSMEGDVDGVMKRPEGDNDEAVSEREKWDAWNAQKGVSKTEAKRLYISTLIETMHRFASNTPEARELVSELEFVWDQIKSGSNPSSSQSSASSSPSNLRNSPTLAMSHDSPSEQLLYLASSSVSHPQPPGPRLPSSTQRATPLSFTELFGSRQGPAASSSRPRRGPIPFPADELQRYAEEGDGRDGDRYQPLNKLPPMSPTDESEAEAMRSDELHDAPPEPEDRLNNFDPESLPDIPAGSLNPRRWRRRVEAALTRMTAEVAALREQLEDSAHPASRQYRLANTPLRLLWRWLRSAVAMLAKHLLVNIVMFMCIWAWWTKKGDPRADRIVAYTKGKLLAWGRKTIPRLY